jgi:hypothetical protein
MMFARHCLLSLPFVALAGCATGGDFPSLAPRPVEQLSFEEPVRVDPPVAADPALRARANALVAEARGGERAFDAAYGEALPRVRAAGGTGSDSWVQAQEAISRVEAARSITSSALADFDTWLTEISAEPVNADLWAEIAQDRAAIAALADAQNRRLNGLKTSVRQP